MPFISLKATIQPDTFHKDFRFAYVTSKLKAKLNERNPLLASCLNIGEMEDLRGKLLNCLKKMLKLKAKAIYLPFLDLKILSVKHHFPATLHSWTLI